jgi:hypothetical protein
MSDFNKACNELIVAIGDDYKRWRLRGEYYSDESIAKFREELTLNPGRKYMKVTNEEVRDCGRIASRVWGFIMLEDDKKFKKGDILMAAGYNAPARNKPRGNIFTGYDVRWTGPNYL